MDLSMLAVHAWMNASLLSIGAAVSLGSGLVLYGAYVAYIHYKYSHIPSPPRPNFFTGHVTDILKARRQSSKEDAFFGLVEYWLQKVNSNTFVVFFFHVPMVITVDPSFITTVLINPKNEKTSMYSQALGSVFGKRFMKESLIALKNYAQLKPNRDLYDPGFEPEYLVSLTPVMNEALEPTLEKMKTMADGATPVNMKDHLKKLTMEATSLVLFGTRFSAEWTPASLGINLPPGCNTDVMTYLLQVCLSGVQKNMTTWMPTMNQYIYPFQAGKYRQCVDALRLMGRTCLMKRINMIKKKEKLPKDVLTKMLLEANDKNLDTEQFVDTFCSFFPMANERLSNTLQLVFILLHQHPNVLENAQHEVTSVLGTKTDITANDLDHLKYMDKVIHEGIRMYYVGPEKSRLLNQDTMAGQYLIPAGTIVQVGESNLYRIAEYFHDPDVFKPERFDSIVVPSAKYSPFGQGPRTCLGKKYCMITAKVIMARLLQTFIIEFPEDYKTVIVKDPIAGPRDDYICTLKKRVQQDE